MIALLRADARHIPLRDESVQCVVTSPPYWGLRDYGIEPSVWRGDPDWLGVLGLEPTPDLYITHMVEVFRDVKRVLRNDGTLWLNMGDCYATGAGKVGEHPGGGAQGARFKEPSRGVGYRGTQPLPGLKPKDLVGMPWRLAFALQADGWYLRQEIIFSKPNPMPESVRDRPTRAHEQIFLLSKRERYFYDDIAVREPAIHAGRIVEYDGTQKNCRAGDEANDRRTLIASTRVVGSNRSIRSVWTIPTQPFPDAHFATFPEDLVRPCIAAGTSEAGGCAECGRPWRRVVEKDLVATRGRVGYHNGDGPRQDMTRMDAGTAWDHSGGVYGRYEVRTLGFRPSCTCTTDLPPVPQLVLDPFGGSGTVALVAAKMGRRAVSLDLKMEYLQMARERTRGVRKQLPLALDMRGAGSQLSLIDKEQS
jgi:DNA modification methylase